MIAMSTCLHLSPSAVAQQATNAPALVRYSSSASLRRLEAPSAQTFMQLSFGSMDDRLKDYYDGHREKFHDIDRDHDDYADDVIRAARQAGIDGLKILPGVKLVEETIEERVNDGLAWIRENVGGFFKHALPKKNKAFALSLHAPHDYEAYRRRSHDREPYKLKLRLSTRPALEFHPSSSLRFRLYHDKANIDYTKRIFDHVYGRIGVKMPFDQDTLFQPHLGIYKEFDHGELGIGFRLHEISQNPGETGSRREKGMQELYGGIFFASWY